jgi:orotidine-5'-phosphate decarboxylase
LEAKDSVIVAQDVDTLAESVPVADMLSEEWGCSNVGLQLMHSAGPEVLEKLKKEGR